MIRLLLRLFRPLSSIARDVHDCRVLFELWCGKQGVEMPKPVAKKDEVELIYGDHKPDDWSIDDLPADEQIYWRDR